MCLPKIPSYLLGAGTPSAWRSPHLSTPLPRMAAILGTLSLPQPASPCGAASATLMPEAPDRTVLSAAAASARPRARTTSRRAPS